MTDLYIREQIHQKVLKSHMPYPTNVSTMIGGQSPDYQRAKKMANIKRNAMKDGMSKEQAYAYAGKMVR